jgi:hypothetical protein
MANDYALKIPRSVLVATVFLSAQIAPNPADLLEQAHDKTVERCQLL